MTYNVHSCVGIDAQLSVQRIADVIASANPDVVCLQEIDAGRRRSRRVHQAEKLAEALAMEFHFYPAVCIADEQYGDAVLARHPMRLVRAEALPIVPRLIPLEPRGALWVTVRIENVTWQIINTHLGLGRSERRIQARALASSRWIASACDAPPLVVCGDFNSRPRSVVHKLMGAALRDVQRVSTGRHARTFSTRLPFVCLDYVLASPAVTVEEVRAVKTALARVASDHYPLIADLSWNGSSKGI